jgi:hypothetical protein
MSDFNIGFLIFLSVLLVSLLIAWFFLHKACDRPDVERPADFENKKTELRAKYKNINFIPFHYTLLQPGGPTHWINSIEDWWQVVDKAKEYLGANTAQQLMNQAENCFKFERQIDPLSGLVNVKIPHDEYPQFELSRITNFEYNLTNWAQDMGMYEYLKNIDEVY